MNEEKCSDHPWGHFLQARIKAIEWMRKEMKYNETM